MSRLGTRFLPIVVLALVVVAVTSIFAVSSIQSLLESAASNNRALLQAAEARADLNRIQLFDLENRTRSNLDREAIDETLVGLGSRLEIALEVLPVEERERTMRIYELYSDVALPEVALAPSTIQAANAQSLYATLLQKIADAETVAAAEAESATSKASTGTTFAALSSLVGVSLLMIYIFWMTNRRAESAIGARYDERFEAIADGSSDYLFVIEEDGALSYLSPAVLRLFESDELVTNVSDILELMEPADAKLVKLGLANPELAVAPQIFPVLMPTGERRRIEMKMADQRDNPAVGALVVSGRDVTEQMTLQDQLAEQAFCDVLTELPNRRALNEALARTVARSKRNGGNPGFLLLDLDGFKGVNDTLGHPVGDALLIEVARRLSEGTRSGEMVGRLGGDEFAVILEDVPNRDAAEAAAERLSSVLKVPFDVDGQLLALGCSGGLVTVDSADDPDELFRRADIALYEAKNRGRGRVEVFTSEMEELLVGQVRLQREVEAGYRNDEFSLVYQPLLTVDGNDPVGFEALMRWNSPVLGVVTPLTFIPVCERSGLIIRLGRWALEEACTQLAEWQRETGNHSLTMSVNVSVVQLEDKDFVAELIAVLAKCGITPESLQLEVTESVLASQVGELIGRLQEIRTLGVRVALDDFGTGYSSMGQLQALPVDCIKIDRSFIEALNNEGDQAGLVVNALVELGRALGLQVIAEGVEELEQLSALVGPQCDLAQGFLLARPMNAVDIPAYMAEFSQPGALTKKINSDRAVS